MAVTAVAATWTTYRRAEQDLSRAGICSCKEYCVLRLVTEFDNARWSSDAVCVKVDLLIQTALFIKIDLY